jgi:hypothetical protein
MESLHLKEKLLWQMTGEELLHLIESSSTKKLEQSPVETSSKKYVYGLRGIAKILGVSTSTASRIKNEGIIKDAIIQNGRTIIVDAELALKLFGKK